MRRITLDLTPDQSKELDRLSAKLGLSMAATLRGAISLLARYQRANEDGHEMQVVDPRGKKSPRVILFVK